MDQFIKKSDIIDLIKEKLSDINAIQKDTIIPEERIVLNKMIKLYKDFCSDIENIEEHEYVQPKYSYFESIYHVGSEPRWKVGDVLAIYNFYHDYEGEEELGEIVDIYMDEDNTDWVYVFKGGEDDGIMYEAQLISEEAYKKYGKEKSL